MQAGDSRSFKLEKMTACLLADGDDPTEIDDKQGQPALPPNLKNLQDTEHTLYFLRYTCKYHEQKQQANAVLA